MQSILRVPNLVSFPCTVHTHHSNLRMCSMSPLCVAGGALGPHLAGAQSPERDAAHHPAGLQDPQDAEEENAGGRQQR